MDWNRTEPVLFDKQGDIIPLQNFHMCFIKFSISYSLRNSENCVEPVVSEMKFPYSASSYFEFHILSAEETVKIVWNRFCLINKAAAAGARGGTHAEQGRAAT